MKIYKLVLGACITNCYIAASEKNRCVIIDPADEAEKIIAEITRNNLKPEYIFITHGHTDHILALEEIKKYYGIPAVISKTDAWRLEDEALINERPYVTKPYRAVRADILISEGDIINLDELTFSFYGMPGHTDGSMAIVTGNIIFSGDTLLRCGHGKTTLPGGNEELLIRSINRMAVDFKGDYIIKTGHREETTLDYERENNPFIGRW